MRKSFLFLLFVITSLSCAYTQQSINFTGSSSVYGLLTTENTDFFVDSDFSSTDLIGIEDVSLTFSPIASICAQIDMSCYGSTIKYYENNIGIHNPFSFDVNQLYIDWNYNNLRFFTGKKVLNGYASFFPLVNIINQRRDDVIRIVNEGSGIIGMNYSPIYWGNFSGLFFFQSKDKNNDLNDVSAALIVDLYFNDFSFSLYSYFKELHDLSEIPFALSFTKQLGLFTFYNETLFRTVSDSYRVIDNSSGLELKEKEKDYFVDSVFGIQFYNSKWIMVLEYCYSMTGYNKNESKDLLSYIQTNPLMFDCIYGTKNCFYKNNIGLSIENYLTSNIAISLSDLITFPDFSSDYIGNKITFGLNCSFQQTLEILGSITYCFGGKNSEFEMYSNNDFLFQMGMKISY